MKRPFSYAILKYMTTVEKASPAMVLAELEPEYGTRRYFSEKAVKEALMTGVQNLLLEEAGCDLEEDDSLTIYYKATPDCIESINHYIK